jgi:hypothetical protein
VFQSILKSIPGLISIDLIVHEMILTDMGETCSTEPNGSTQGVVHHDYLQCIENLSSSSLLLFVELYAIDRFH